MPSIGDSSPSRARLDACKEVEMIAARGSAPRDCISRSSNRPCSGLFPLAKALAILGSVSARKSILRCSSSSIEDSKRTPKVMPAPWGLIRLDMVSRAVVINPGRDTPNMRLKLSLVDSNRGAIPPTDLRASLRAWMSATAAKSFKCFSLNNTFSDLLLASINFFKGRPCSAPSLEMSNTARRSASRRSGSLLTALTSLLISIGLDKAFSKMMALSVPGRRVLFKKLSNSVSCANSSFSRIAPKRADTANEVSTSFCKAARTGWGSSETMFWFFCSTSLSFFGSIRPSLL